MKLGKPAGRFDCTPVDTPTYAWQSPDTSIVSVSASGLVRGIAPGWFDIFGVRGDDTVGTYAFVLPRGWQHRIEPDSVTVHVGDSVAFRMIAFDSAGKTYSFAPFTLYTPEFLQDTRDILAGRKFPQGGRPSLTNRRIVERDTVLGVFRAERPGVTSIIGDIGTRQDTAKLVILPPLVRQ